MSDTTQTWRTDAETLARVREIMELRLVSDDERVDAIRLLMEDRCSVVVSVPGDQA